MVGEPGNLGVSDVQQGVEMQTWGIAYDIQSAMRVMITVVLAGGLTQLLTPL